MAIDRVTGAIVDAIKASLRNAPGVPPGAFNIVIGAPNGSGGNADLVLFLYLITPAPELRNAERIRPFPGPADPPRLLEPAVPLELHYLLSLGAQTASSTLQGLSLLGDAIRAIEAASPIAVPGAGQAVWLSLLPLTTDEMSRIWGLFPNENCRSSFAFRASPVWIDPREATEPAPAVTDDAAVLGRKDAA